jgi:hypothetical protein
MVKTIQVTAILLTAIAMAAGWAHLLELPNKIHLPRNDYLTVQQIYRGWAFLGVAVVGALISTVVLTTLQRGKGASFYLVLAATFSIALSLAVFFIFTFPANKATQNWTILPEGWERLRFQWEYSHATGALLYFVALTMLAISASLERR